MLVVVNLDPHHAQSGWVDARPARRSASSRGRPFQVHDLLTDARYPVARARATTSSSTRTRCPAHVFRVRRARAPRARLRLLPVQHWTPMTPPRLETAAPPADDPLWYKDAVIYQLHVKAFFDRNDDGIGDFRGLTAEARLHPGPRRQHDLAAAVLSVAAAATTATTSPTTTTSTRSTARSTDFQALRARGARARPARDHRAGHQPHLRPASVVPGRAPRAAGLAQARLLRLERHRPEVRGHAHHLHRHRDVELDLGPGGASSTTGTASSATSPT